MKAPFPISTSRMDLWHDLVAASHDSILQALDCFTAPDDLGGERFEIAARVETALLDLDAELLDSYETSGSPSVALHLRGALKHAAMSVQQLAEEMEMVDDHELSWKLHELGELYEEFADALHGAVIHRTAGKKTGFIVRSCLHPEFYTQYQPSRYHPK